MLGAPYLHNSFYNWSKIYQARFKQVCPTYVSVIRVFRWAVFLALEIISTMLTPMYSTEDYCIQISDPSSGPKQTKPGMDSVPCAAQFRSIAAVYQSTVAQSPPLAGPSPYVPLRIFSLYFLRGISQ